jgi:GH24 family phage-related lysozyme (muramidase)
VNFVDELRRWEGWIPWLYLDTRGNVTVGMGFLVKTVADAQELPLWNGHQLASSAAIKDAFESVSRMKPGLVAVKYKRLPHLTLSEDEIRTRAERRLATEFTPGIVKLLPEFATFPPHAQSALVDLAWNLGVNGLGNFRHLLAACEAKDWTEAAAQCRRRTSRDERNAWTRDQFLAAASEPIA